MLLFANNSPLRTLTDLEGNAEASLRFAANVILTLLLQQRPIDDGVQLRPKHQDTCEDEEEI
jgi:hypothetical protein